ncbi:MAG: phosphatidate cytidylyltransferase [Clostridia bacterium]|nr:phosphatidate cytidylyltransferase [Clostridia bacterium]
MLKRTITGFFILLVTAGFIALREVSLLFFDAFSLAIVIGSIVEMSLACKFSNKKVNKLLLLVYPILLTCIFILVKDKKTALLLILASLLLMFALLMAKELIVNSIIRKKGETISDVDELNKSLLNETKNTLEIMVYPTTLLSFLMGINHFGLNIGYVGIIMTFAISMFTDVFAYLFGSMIKGPKMAPEISPKKSISGMIFGALGGIIASGLAYLCFVHFGWFGNSFAHLDLSIIITIFVVAGFVGTFLTQFGDLVASAYKRKVGIKDFGSIFPGHGGFMDRVDGLMFTGSLIYILFALFI